MKSKVSKTLIASNLAIQCQRLIKLINKKNRPLGGHFRDFGGYLVLPDLKSLYPTETCHTWFLIVSVGAPLPSKSLISDNPKL